MIDKFLSCLTTLLCHCFELLATSFLREKLGWNRVREDHQPGWEEELGSWYNNEEREGDEFEEIATHLLKLDVLFIGFFIILEVDLSLLESHVILKVCAEQLETLTHFLKLVPNVMAMMAHCMNELLAVTLEEVSGFVGK